MRPTERGTGEAALRIDDFVGESRPDLPRPTQPPGGWFPPTESVAYQEGLPIAAWLSWTCQKAGIYEEDPIAGLLCEANCAIGHVDTSEHRQYLAWAITSATRHYVALLESLRAALSSRGDAGEQKAADVGGWRETESAPKDLTILLVYTREGNTFSAQWRVGAFGVDGYWETVGGPLRTDTVTHWMPLPEAPK